MWECDVCRDYFLCENCYKGSLEDCDVLSAPSQVHNRDHCMSPHVTTFGCDGCGSYPVWNQRWHCKVCYDFDLCEACYGELDAADLPLEHSEEHPMIAVEVSCSEMDPRLQSSFSKPVDPQWSYRACTDISSSGFSWIKGKPLTKILSTSHMSIVEVDATTVTSQTSPKTDEDNSGYISLLQRNTSLKFKSLPLERGLETSATQRVLDKKHKIFLSHAGAQKHFVEELHQELTKVHRFGTFFDKDDGSLPRGESFPEKILNAAKHCELAIVVISTDYFTRKWPMLELATFVKEQKRRPELKILPVFYKLSAEEFKQPKRQQSYVKIWNQMSSVFKDDIHLWKEALKVISRTTGIEFDKNMENGIKKKNCGNRLQASET